MITFNNLAYLRYFFHICQWVGGWIDGWMGDEWEMDGWVGEWTGRRITGGMIDGWRMDGWVHGWV